jgi:MFS family permease
MVQKTQWARLYALSIFGGLSWLGSALTTFTVILRDKDEIGAGGVSLLLLAMAVPTIVLSPLAGYLADRYSTRAVVIPLLIVMGFSSGSLAIPGMPTWYAPIALAITAACGTPVGPAFQAALATIAKPEDLPRVQGLMQTSSSLGTLAAPGLGGVLTETTGYFWPFIIDMSTFWLMAIGFFFIGINRPGQKPEHGEKLSALEGIRFAMNDKLIRAIIILLTVLVLALGAINVGEVFLVMDELGASKLIYGFVAMLFAAGAIVGALVTAAIKVDSKYHGRLLVIAIGVLTSTVIAFSLTTHWWQAMVLSFIAGLGNAALNAYAVGIIMAKAPQAARGRVMAAFGAIVTTGSVTATAASGALITAFEVRPVLLVGGILAAIVFVLLSPAVLRAGREHRLAQSPESDRQLAPEKEPQR